jgi:hypothetical protein
MDAYDLHEGRFIQEPVTLSAADALSISSLVVPPGKVWTILSARYNPSATETRTVQFGILTKGGSFQPIRVPVSVALGVAIYYPLLTEGMEFKIYPGERIQAVRDVATAASTMLLLMRLIETDLPYYSYEDPLKKIIAQPFKHGSIFRGARPSVSGGGGGRPEGGGGGGPKPI